MSKPQPYIVLKDGRLWPDAAGTVYKVVDVDPDWAGTNLDLAEALTAAETYRKERNAERVENAKLLEALARVKENVVPKGEWANVKREFVKLRTVLNNNRDTGIGANAVRVIVTQMDAFIATLMD